MAVFMDERKKEKKIYWKNSAFLSLTPADAFFPAV
jgi:hypothetical protein